MNNIKTVFTKTEIPKKSNNISNANIHKYLRILANNLSLPDEKYSLIKKHQLIQARPEDVIQ
jgi:hypothetical protein